ncbi:hypothetical protein EKO27_g2041 [Xylaria grammica]|uniref:Uncharacterized protein n=1 Tax=Xylaria grammica TaxID=363999 RepID=A0A439DF65_9PEZI|nr:hypothetical protein EKO27_g2041 [Xylaria grammica]
MHGVAKQKTSDDLPGLAEAWRSVILKALGSICSLKILRERPKPPLRLAFSIALFMPISYSWYLLELSDNTSGVGHATSARSDVGGNGTQDSVTDGLRMVVFGGGDVATPALSAREWSDQAYAWTEIMCRKLQCDTYLSFVPGTDGMGGAVVSNEILDAAYERISAPTDGANRDDGVVKPDYSWATEQYQKPHQHDLAAQVDSFLSSPLPQRASTESLWVFNVGYWDIWYLAALPRRLATEVLDSNARDLFFQIERLYHATQERQPVAFPVSYSDPASSTPIEIGSGAGRIVRAPFRIFLTRLFDISLTPGFVSARPRPPKPHSSSDHLRNAAFLTKYWNSLLDVAVDDWLTTSDPEYWPVTDKIDIKVIEALVGKRSLTEVEQPKEKSEGKDHRGRDDTERSGRISLPRRKVASYGISHYLRELIIDRQLRNADLFDHNGLGARPPEDGFLDISMPCVLKVMGDEDTEETEAADTEGKMVVCQDPDNYLFYTEFTVGQRAIHEIGVRAARRFLYQVEFDSGWRERSRIHKEGVLPGRKEHNMAESISV